MKTMYKSVLDKIRDGKSVDACELDSLECGIEQYQEQIFEMQAHIDCLKAELREIQCHSDKLNQELKMKDGTKMFDTLIENSSGEARELLAQHLYENLCCVELNRGDIKSDLPSDPMDVASMLIKATEIVKTNSIQRVFNPNMPDEYETEKYSKSDLRQIAEHLLVYCNNAENEN